MRLTKEPKQQRSRDTLAFIFQATIELIRDSPDGSFSLRAVAERAGISQGTLYARFPTRDELLLYVHHRHWERNVEAMQAFAAQHATTPDEHITREHLEALAREAIAYYTRHMRDGRPVLQALTRAMDHDPKLSALQREQSARQLGRVFDIARGVLGDRWTPELQARLELAVRITVGLVRDTSLLGPNDPASMWLDVDTMVERLTPIVMGLIDPSAPAGAPVTAT